MTDLHYLSFYFRALLMLIVVYISITMFTNHFNLQNYARVSMSCIDKKKRTARITTFCYGKGHKLLFLSHRPRHI